MALRWCSWAVLTGRLYLLLLLCLSNTNPMLQVSRALCSASALPSLPALLALGSQTVTLNFCFNSESSLSCQLRMRKSWSGDGAEHPLLHSLLELSHNLCSG